MRLSETKNAKVKFLPQGDKTRAGKPVAAYATRTPSESTSAVSPSATKKGQAAPSGKAKPNPGGLPGYVKAWGAKKGLTSPAAIQAAWGEGGTTVREYHKGASGFLSTYGVPGGLPRFAFQAFCRVTTLTAGQATHVVEPYCDRVKAWLDQELAKPRGANFEDDIKASLFTWLETQQDIVEEEPMLKRARFEETDLVDHRHIFLADSFPGLRRIEVAERITGIAPQGCRGSTSAAFSKWWLGSAAMRWANQVHAELERRAIKMQQEKDAEWEAPPVVAEPVPSAPSSFPVLAPPVHGCQTLSQALAAVAPNANLRRFQATIRMRLTQARLAPQLESRRIRDGISGWAPHYGDYLFNHVQGHKPSAELRLLLALHEQHELRSAYEEEETKDAAAAAVNTPAETTAPDAACSDVVHIPETLVIRKSLTPTSAPNCAPWRPVLNEARIDIIVARGWARARKTAARRDRALQKVAEKAAHTKAVSESTARSMRAASFQPVNLFEGAPSRREQLCRRGPANCQPYRPLSAPAAVSAPKQEAEDWYQPRPRVESVRPRKDSASHKGLVKLARTPGYCYVKAAHPRHWRSLAEQFGDRMTLGGLIVLGFSPCVQRLSVRGVSWWHYSTLEPPLMGPHTAADWHSPVSGVLPRGTLSVRPEAFYADLPSPKAGDLLCSGSLASLAYAWAPTRELGDELVLTLEPNAMHEVVEVTESALEYRAQGSEQMARLTAPVSTNLQRALDTAAFFRLRAELQLEKSEAHLASLSHDDFKSYKLCKDHLIDGESSTTSAEMEEIHDAFADPSFCATRCGHSHESFSDRESCRVFCHHTHEDFADFPSCTQRILSEGVRDMSSTIVDVDEEPVELPVSSTADQFSMLVEPVLQEPQHTGPVVLSLMLNQLIEHLNTRRVVTAQTERFISQQTGLYFYSVEDVFLGERRVAVKVQRTAKLNMNFARHDLLSLAPDAWVSGIRNAALAVVLRERLSSSHMPGRECDAHCSHHKTATGGVYPAAKRRACKQYCGHEPLDFPEYVNLRAKVKDLEDQLAARPAQTGVEARIVELENEVAIRDRAGLLMEKRIRELESTPKPAAPPVATARVDRIKSALKAWDADWRAPVRAAHSREAITHLGSIVSEAPASAQLLPPPSRVFKPNVLSRWWNNVDQAIQINDRTFAWHSAGLKPTVLIGDQLVKADPSARTQYRSFVATWALLEYAYDRLKGRGKQPEFLAELQITESQLRERAVMSRRLGYLGMARSTYLKKWDRATTKPSDPGPGIADVLRLYANDTPFLSSPQTDNWRGREPAGRDRNSPLMHGVVDEPVPEYVPECVVDWLESLPCQPPLTITAGSRPQDEVKGDLHLTEDNSPFSGRGLAAARVIAAAWYNTQVRILNGRPKWENELPDMDAESLYPTPFCLADFVWEPQSDYTRVRLITWCWHKRHVYGADEAALAKYYSRNRPHTVVIPSRQLTSVALDALKYWQEPHVRTGSFTLYVKLRDEVHGPFFVNDMSFAGLVCLVTSLGKKRLDPGQGPARYFVVPNDAGKTLLWKRLGNRVVTWHDVIDAYPDGGDLEEKLLYWFARGSTACVLQRHWFEPPDDATPLGTLALVSSIALRYHPVDTAVEVLTAPDPVYYSNELQDLVRGFVTQTRHGMVFHRATCRCGTQLPWAFELIAAVSEPRCPGCHILVATREHGEAGLSSAKWVDRVSCVMGSPWSLAPGTYKTVKTTRQVPGRPGANNYAFELLRLRTNAASVEVTFPSHHPAIGVASGQTAGFRGDVADVGLFPVECLDLIQCQDPALLGQFTRSTFRQGCTWPKKWLEMRVGLPYVPFELALHNDEVTIYRGPGKPGIHHTSFKPAHMVVPQWLSDMVEGLARLVKNKRVISTANPNCPLPRRSRVGCNFGDHVASWNTISVPPEFRGRCYALWRLLPLYAGAREVWIINGRDAQEQVEPSLVPGRFHSANTWNAMPIILASTKTDVELPRCGPGYCEDLSRPCLGRFAAAMHLYGNTYGVDEWLLQRAPLTSTHYRQLSDVDFRILPLDDEFPDVEMSVRGEPYFRGNLSRINLLNQPAPRPSGRLLSSLDRAAAVAGDFGLEGIRVPRLTSPFDKPPTPRKDTLLITVLGSYGDLVPMEYLARVIIASGVPAVLWVTQTLEASDFDQLKAGNVIRALPGFLAAIGAHNLGYKAVLAPNFRMSLNTIKYTLANWETTARPSLVANPQAWLAAFLIQYVDKGLVIGNTPGCNTPRSANGRTMLLSQQPAQTRRPCAWVECSDGVQAVPMSIRNSMPGITRPYDPSCFCEYEVIYCSGSQGVVDTILAHGAKAMLFDAWFDQKRTIALVPEVFTEPTWQALGEALYHHGFESTLPKPSWSRRYTQRIPNLRQGLRSVITLVTTSQLLLALAPWFGTFPSLALEWPGRLALLHPVMRTLMNVPLLYSWCGTKSVAYLIIFWYLFEQIPLVALGMQEGVKLRLELNPGSWLFVRHASLVHTKKKQTIEYGWYGARNLLAPFQGRVWNIITPVSPQTIEIPVAIDFEALKRDALNDVGKYGPFFNCQSQLLTKLGNNAPAVTILVLSLVYAGALVFAPWLLIVLSHHLGIKICGRKPIDLIRLGDTEADEIPWLLAETFDDEDDLPADVSPVDDVPAEASRDSFLDLTDEDQALAALQYVFSELPEDEVTPDALILDEAVQAWKAMVDVQEDQPLAEYYEPVEGDSLTSWAEDFVRWALQEIRTIGSAAPIARDLVRFLFALKDNVVCFAEPMLQILRVAFKAIVELTRQLAPELVRLASRLVDLAFGHQVTRKLKAAWFGAELLKGHKLSVQHRIREQLAFSHFLAEGNFDDQYKKDTAELRAAYRASDVDWDRLQAMSEAELGSKKRFVHRGPRGFGGPVWKPLPLPRSAVMSEQELELLMAEVEKENKAGNPVNFNARVDQYFTARVARLTSGGTDLATDGALLAAIRPAQAEASLIRYTYHGIEPNTALGTNTQPMTPERRDRLLAIADAYYETNKDLFDDPKLTPPEATIEWWKHRGMTKFNTTAPLNMASRAHAIVDGQMTAIVRNVYEKLKAGEYPHQYYAAKVKQQAVPARKLVTPDANGDLKPVRTFVAQDHRSTAADWTVGLELKNRLPGENSGESSKMAAGQGYSPLFRKIRGKENIFMGDMARYDSQLERDHFFMLDRCLERGVSDKVVRSILQAKHAAMQSSYIAVLSLPRDKPLEPFLAHARASMRDSTKAAVGYENWILKIRSGATGESSTNWTDSKTFRLTFGLIVADYCDYFGLPFDAHAFFGESDKYNLTNSGDDNMGHLDFLAKQGHVLNPIVMVAMARKNNMVLDFAVLDTFDKCEFLGCMARVPTQADLRTLDRVRALFKAVNVRSDLVKYARLNEDLVDPATKEKPDIIVYRNLTNSLVRQTATVLHGNVHKNEVYLEKWLAKYVGHLQLCAFSPVRHQETMMEYVQTAMRYLYAATPNHRRDQQGIVLLPEGEEYEKILALLNLQYEDVNKRLFYARPKSSVASKDPWYTAEFRRRLNRLSQQPPAAYSKVIGIHMAYGKKPKEYYEAKMAKILSGLYPIDETAKLFLDTLRSAVGEASRKLVKGFQPQARDQMYLEDIYDSGHYRVEAAIWLTWEEKVMAAQADAEEDDIGRPEMTLPLWQGLCSKAAFGSITDPLRFYALMQDKDFADSIRSERAYAYRNCMWLLVMFYVLLWRLEVWIHSVPIFGLSYSLFMFMVIDMSKVYGLISMLYWLEYMDVHPVISSWMPRDPYVLAKRLASWQLKFVPMSVARLLPFALTSGLLGDGCAWFAQLFNRAQSLKPLAGHGTPIDNPWTSDAHRMLDLLSDPVKTPDNAIVLRSATGTGKSALGTDALTRLLRHSVAPRGRMWVFVPTRILLKDPMPAFLQRGQDGDPQHKKTYQVLRRGVAIDPTAEILFMTYGHGRNRLLSGEFQKGVDTAFVDEMHMLSAEQRLVCESLRGERMIMSSATDVPPPGFVAPVFQSSQRKRWKANRVIFPASTNVASMFQRAHSDTAPVLGMKHSPAELSKRTLILCASFNELDNVAESLITLRKSMFGGGIGVSLPPVVEVSSRIKPGTEAWMDRQRAFEAGEYIALGTKQAATGMDIKPNPPWLLVDGGEDIYSHEGTIVRLPTTPQDDEQRAGRVTRNSSDRDGLIYCREQAGSRPWATVEYPAVSYCTESLIAKAYNLPQLLPVENPALELWPYFRLQEGFETHVREALVFAVLASVSGVTPARLEEFYSRHWQHQIPLSDDYEWMDTLMRRQGRRSAVSAPAWVTVLSVLGQRPIGWNTHGIHSGERRSDGLVYGNMLYPVAGVYLSYEEMQRSQGKRTFTSQENRAEDIAADIINRQSDVIDRLQRQIRALESKREPTQPLSAEEKSFFRSRAALRHAVKMAVKGHKASHLNDLADSIIMRYRRAERPPGGVYTGPDLSAVISSTEGWGYCTHDGTSAVIGESGPAEGSTETLPCGHNAHATGDHVIADTFWVVKRGSNWTSAYAVADTENSRNRVLASITDDDIREGQLAMPLKTPVSTDSEPESEKPKQSGKHKTTKTNKIGGNGTRAPGGRRSQ